MPDAGVLIAHPTRQHSHRLAQALLREGLLQSYWTLLPDEDALPWIPKQLLKQLPSTIRRHPLKELPRQNLHVLLGPLLGQKLGSRFSSLNVRLSGEWFAWALFDHWVALQLSKVRPKVVVGYEMCCARTFCVAKSLGIKCVLDAAAVHYQLQEQLLADGREGRSCPAGRRLRARKAVEIELSDKIICVSDFARSSYASAGVDRSKLLVNPVGCDVMAFSRVAARERTGPPKFVYAGIPAAHKGFDLLVQTFDRLRQEYEKAELHIAGDPAFVSRFVAEPLGGLTIHGKLSHADLIELLANMDCLVLPSRLESFGMVTVEALAAGIPVIVSDHAGSAEAIRNGENGWVFTAGNVDELYERMAACCENIDHVRTKRTICTESARTYDWSHYSRRCVEIFSELLRSMP